MGQNNSTAAARHELEAAVDPSGGSHEGVLTAATRDTWAETGEGWRMMRSENLSETMAVDGASV